ncbi:tetratricopeptide repeat protein [Qipengyuania vesicularis]|uniref:tetratricopeptide repeat protein n=1 Tax=Qipengyuania vesicularis TaxID=2867232 RepID=UPI001C88225E|nr:tetratricopeptide repeat protein [Qipengyuania vesicularis]MBX7527608.1 tetratricopeptide repeat protein [Qipengyuania vesicularis]
MIARSARALGLGGIALALMATSMPVAAQDNSEARIRKLEAEVRALQRKVFPGGDGRYFEPEITGAPVTTPAATTTTPSTTAVTDILARLDALESQLQRLTAQYEVGGNALRLLEERIEALEAANAPPPEPEPEETAAREPEARPNPARVAAVQAIAKPQTDDAGDDEYSYGFRLWDAGFFPEAQQQLTMFVEEYPNHSRTSFGRNLLGRAYLDDGKPTEAAPWFLRNYQADKNGARAGDSLLYLAESMIALEDTSRACIALAEFAETYPALATGRLSGPYATARSKVTCG